MTAAQRWPSASTRPLHDLLMSLPAIEMKAGAIDVAGTSPIQLRHLLKHAEAASMVTHAGINAMGQALALAASETVDGGFSASAVEAFGWLIAELADLAATCDALAAQCRKALAGEVPAPHSLNRAQGGGE